MNFSKGLTAFFMGLQLCLTVPAIRRLALLPWLLGLISYPLLLWAAYALHSPVVEALAPEPSGFVNSILFGLGWIAATLILLLATLLLGLVLILICTAAFQTAIVERVLLHTGDSKSPVNEEAFKISVILKESFSAVLTESVKLIWLLPLIITSFVLGFIPLLSPLAVLLTAWLLAFQFIDIVLDVAQFSASKRIRYAARHYIGAISFGLTITLVFLIPFAGVLLGPVATAGAAWALAGEREIWKDVPNRS